MPYHMGDYYHSKTGAVVMSAGIALLCLYLAQIMIEKLPANAFFKLLISWSRDVNRIYLIQWIMIMWGACFLATTDFPQRQFWRSVWVCARLHTLRIWPALSLTNA